MIGSITMNPFNYNNYDKNFQLISEKENYCSIFSSENFSSNFPANKPVTFKDPNRFYFGNKTNNLNSKKIPHKTDLLKIAEKFLGTIEVTPEEYMNLNFSQKQKTNISIVYKNQLLFNSAWCACTVSFLCQKAGIDIGLYKMSVNEYINWAGEKYNQIHTNYTPPYYYGMNSERKKRAQQIKAQLPLMHEGDFIIWKSQYAAKLDTGIIKSDNIASHIGIIESVDTKKGIVTVIEGNANEFVTGINFERKLVTNEIEGRCGAQEIGEFQEENSKDGIIRKQYTIQELANFGYSGFIDNSSIIK